MSKTETMPKPNSDQRQRFIETARGLGCDEDEDAFMRKLGKIVTAKPKDESADKP